MNETYSFEKNEPMVHRERTKFAHSRITSLWFIAKEQKILIREKQTYSSSRKSEICSIAKDELKNKVQKDFTYEIHSNIMDLCGIVLNMCNITQKYSKYSK